MAFLAATIVLSRRAERAAYKQIEGQPGAVGAALRSIRRGWYIEETPVAADAQRATDLQSAALVYRAVGRPGIVLIGEGPSGRAQKLLVAERRKVERVASGVPVTLLRVGEGGTEDEVSIRKLANRVQRMKPVLTKDEVVRGQQAAQVDRWRPAAAAQGCGPDQGAHGPQGDARPLARACALE